VSQPLSIIGIGAITAVGFTAPQTCAAIRAAVAGFTESAVQNPVQGPTLWAEVPLRPRALVGQTFGRLVHLSAFALQECVAATGVDPARCALLLGVREPFRVTAQGDWTNPSLLTAVQHQVSAKFHSASQVIAEGNTSAFKALARARELLADGSVSACVVGGVDSFLNMPDLERFGRTYRLKSDEVAQGFIPGEAAAFVVVTTPSLVRGRAIWSTIRGIGLAREDPTTTVLSDGHPNGKGLEQAMHTAIADAAIPESDIAFRTSDLNGETFRGQESMLAMSRFYRTRRPGIPHIFPAASVGETGAAVGALLLAVTATAMARGYAPGPVAMCETSSDAGTRAVCVLSQLPT
jgi:3-oxoacyl-[acyl-carrier-protein] synthase-1